MLVYKLYQQGDQEFEVIQFVYMKERKQLHLFELFSIKEKLISFKISLIQNKNTSYLPAWQSHIAPCFSNICKICSLFAYLLDDLNNIKLFGILRV